MNTTYLCAGPTPHPPTEFSVRSNLLWHWQVSAHFYYKQYTEPNQIIMKDLSIYVPLGC